MNSGSSSNSDLMRIFELQGEAIYAAKTSSAEQRKAKLARFRHAIVSNSDAVCDALFADLRRPRQLAYSAEIAATLAEIDDAIAHLEQWMAPVDVAPSLPIPGAKAQIRYEALGRVLILGPWNFPVGLVFQPIIPAIAAGNTVMVKPNEMAPHCSAVVAKVLDEAFDEADLAVVEGGVDVAEALLELPFNHIFFTGSPKVGRVVMAAAARHLASVTLELGGKSPVLVDKTADLRSAATKIAGGRCTNAGQLCLAPDIVWVHREVRDAFLTELCGALQAAYFVDGKLNGDALGKIIDDRNFARVSGCIDDAVSRGAQIAFGGGHDAAQRLIEPTVLTHVPQGARILDEETFGPVLPVLEFSELSEVLDYIQARGKPLAAYIFSQNKTLIEQFLANTSSGGVTINGVIVHCAETRLPFGGVNDSGIGRYHSIHGFKQLSHERAIFELAG